MDHFRALKVFCVVSDSKGFAKAARNLRMSPPTITRIINELESHLGSPLFNRTTRQTSLTETGLVYLEYARRLIEDLQTADSLARGDNVKPSGTLKVTAPAMFGRLHIVPIIQEFLDRYPDVRVEGKFVDRVVNLVEESVDVAIRIGDLPDSSLKARKVNSVRQVICGSPDYFKKFGIPSNPRELKKHNIIGIGLKGEYQNWKFDHDISVDVQTRMAFSTIAPCLEAAIAGWGLTRVLTYQIGRETKTGQLQTVLKDYSLEERPIHLVHAEGRMRSAKVKAFVDLASARLRANTSILKL